MAVSEVKKPHDKLQRAYASDHAAELDTLGNDLLQSIRGGTLTHQAVDTFLRQTVPLSAELIEYLLCEKARLLLREGRDQQAIRCYDEALEVNDQSPSTWLAKGAGLMELSRLDEAFKALGKAYVFRDYFGNQRQEWLKILFEGWSKSSLLRGLFGVLHEDLSEAEKGVYEYLRVVDKAKVECMQDVVVNQLAWSADTKLTPLELLAISDLELMIRLLSIEDPFEGWRALTKEISKVWPQDVSAIDAIREQRE